MSGSRQFAVSRYGDRRGYYAGYNPHVNVNHVWMQQPQLSGQSYYYYQQQQQVQMMEVDKQNEYGGSDAAFSVPPVMSLASSSSGSGVRNNRTNLDSFLESVTPIVPARPAEVTGEADIHPYYCIGDLWESFQEWSAYGAGVPFLLSGIHPTTQYYVPFLSGMQLYVNPKNAGFPAKEPDQGASSVLERSFNAICLNQEKQKQILLRENNCGSHGRLVYEFMEQEQPYTRKTLSEKAAVLVSQFPELSKYRSCDLSPSSWICVAWYPIYRIPVGPTLKDLEASFLTLHSLSTQPGSYNGSEFSSRNADGVHETLDLSSKIPLPVIGLASYKLKGSIIAPCDPREREQEMALFEAARNWLENLQAYLPDYQFFRRRY